MKILERAANLATIAGVAVFLVLVLRGELAKRRAPDMSPNAFVGKTVRLPGVSFPQPRASLVLALSTSCHFCKESLPFYKDLADQATGRVNVVALLPQSQAEAQSYVQEAGVKATQVVSSSLDSIGVNATPTVLLLDGTGKVQGAWVGLLDEKAQRNLLAMAFAR